ncbi:MAG TPA: GNAT family N-acetyltransferase [Actinomycetota bacterium]|nr:GNAT family N-acetyltransferase [Actinomycetota bacterium]
MDAEIRPVGLEQIRLVRHRLLRPRERPEELVYAGDDASDALHLGAFEGEQLVGIASVVRQAITAELASQAGGEPTEGTPQEVQWRLRGMATFPHARGRGHGARLVWGCVEHARSLGGRLLWCTARLSAEGFYRRLGFEGRGRVFGVPGLGPHELMLRWIEPAAREPAVPA